MPLSFLFLLFATNLIVGQVPPIANDDIASTIQNTPLNSSAPGLLENDTHGAGDVIIITEFLINGTTYIAGQTANFAEGDITIFEDGSYTFTVPAGQDYTVYVTKEFYFTEVQNVSSRDGKSKKTVNIYIASIPNVDMQTGDLNEPIKIVSGSESAYPDLPLPTINHIYYDLNKSDIRPDAMVELDKIVVFMNSNPQMKIELGSHTDARGSDDYNQKLSEQRAKAAMDYIIAKGISASNITAVGYGETSILNRCLNDVECSDKEHEQNRRTEFLITGFVVTE